MKLYKFSSGKVGITMTYEEWKAYGEKRDWTERLTSKDESSPSQKSKRKTVQKKV